MMDVALGLFYAQSVQALFFTHAAQGGYRQYLSLPPGEQAGAMRSGQEAHLTADRSDFIQFTAVDTFAVLQGHFAHDFFHHGVDQGAHLFELFRVNLGKMLEDAVMGLVHISFAGFFIGIAHRLIENVISISPHCGVHLFIHLRQDYLHFGLLQCGYDRLLEGHDLFDFFVSEEDGVDHGLFRHFVGAALHHHDGFFGSGHCHVQVSIAGLLNRGVDHQLSVHQPYDNCSQGAIEGDIGDA